MVTLTTVQFEMASSASISQSDSFAFLPHVVTGTAIVADSSGMTSVGYKITTVEKILKAQKSQAARAPASKQAFYEWLND